MNANWAVFLRGPKGGSAAKLFESLSDAETFRRNVAEKHPEINTFTALIPGDDQGAINWALGADNIR